MTTEIDGHANKYHKDETEVTKKIKEKGNNEINLNKMNQINDNNKFNIKKKKGNDERLKFNLDDADELILHDKKDKCNENNIYDVIKDNHLFKN